MRIAVTALLLLALVVVLPVAVPAADTYAPASIDVSGLISKVDAARGKLADGFYHQVVQVTSGGTTTTEDVRIHGDDYIETDTSGVFTTAQGSYHGTDWHQDENGAVFAETGFHERVDPNVHALANAAESKSYVHVLGMTESSPQQIVLDVNPPGGQHERLYYDASTYLLERTEVYGRDLHLHVRTYSDYRKVFGRMVAFETAYGDGRPENDEVSKTSAFDTATYADADFAIPQSRPLFALDNPGPFVLPISVESDGQLILHATIKGQAYDFVLDSGAAELVIDAGVAHKLGLTQYGRSGATIAGDVDFSRTKIDDVTVGPIHLKNATFTVGPFNNDTECTKVVGLIGADFFANGIYGIDYVKNRVIYFPREAFSRMTANAASTPIKLDDQIPVVEAQLAGKKGLFLLDTGAQVSIVYPDYFKRTGAAGKRTFSNDIMLEGVGGEIPAHSMTVPDLILGHARIEDLAAYVPEESTFQISDYDGILGRNVLTAYSIYFDYANSAAFLVPNPGPPPTPSTKPC